MSAALEEDPFPEFASLARRIDERCCKLNDGDCPRCRMGLHHENAVVLYSPSKGTYVPERDYVTEMYEDPKAEICSARWATGEFGDHGAGELCGRYAEERIGDVPVCRHHYKRALDWVRTETRRERERLHAEAEARREAAEQKRAELFPPLVYFVERDGFVKIGYTTNLDKRIKAISKGSCLIEGMTVGPVRLLATIPDAGLDDEKQLHRRFAHLRVGGEWFRPDADLRAYIAALPGCVTPDLAEVSA
ncbi:GIY-YIG nuclease family protein [Thermomonospora cellulosilytica]|uniref:Bacteriophage T5 Orf172 DNA-binding domain-containing protein n=1 Tax=Thermomonospora cellulosilytica TaxID=1411118 RepID=A0A7W3R8G1_9ACTN|nr:GIY-YIG nuclease family protein [Thermomonospora cellulosilytica]MBA9003676.1 hypothetical protein [Thermomonospora cellulosilytica]